MSTRLRRSAVALLAATLAAGVLGAVPMAGAVESGTIGGTVTGPGGAISGAQVTFYSYDTIDDSYYYAGYTFTGSDGTYSKAVEVGDYRISFDDYSTGDHVGEYYDDQLEFEDADAVTVTNGPAAVADAVLAPASHVTGTVTGPAGTTLEEGVYVYAYRLVTDEGGETGFEQQSGAYASGSGAYDLGGLSPGTYRIQFGSVYSGVDHPTSYATEWWPDRPSLESGTDLVVPDEDVVEDINAQLALDSEVSGRMTDADGDAITSGAVSAFRKVGKAWNHVSEADVDADGDYVLDGLQPGTYRIFFRDYSGHDVVTEWWNNKGLRVNASDVVVGTNVEVPAINAQMVLGEHDAEVAPAFASTADPAISGAPVVGQTLTASAGSWSPQPTELYYDWYRDGVLIVGASAPTYVLTAADLGATISVGVTAGDSDSDHAYGFAESAAVGPVTAVAPVVVPPAVVPPAAAPPVVDVPTALTKALAALEVTGKPKVGKTVKVANLDLDLRTAVTYRFQWYAGAKEIRKATKSKLRVISSMKGKKLSVRVTGKAGTTARSVKLKAGRVR